MNCIWCDKPIRSWQKSKPNLTGRYQTVREHDECQEQRLVLIAKGERMTIEALTAIARREFLDESPSGDAE